MFLVARDTNRFNVLFFSFNLTKKKNLNSNPGRLARGAIVLKRLVLTWTEQRTCREKGGCGVNVGDWSKRYCALRVQDAILKTIFPTLFLLVLLSLNLLQALKYFVRSVVCGGWNEKLYILKMFYTLMPIFPHQV